VIVTLGAGDIHNGQTSPTYVGALGTNFNVFAQINMGMNGAHHYNYF
jgi:hypothetical protein